MNHVDAERERIETTARATCRIHGGSPLTGTAPFWERLVSEVLAAARRLEVAGGPSPTVGEVARGAAPAMAGSPVTSSERLWAGIVATVLSEHAAPSGLGNPTPMPAVWHAIVQGRSIPASRPPRGH